MVIRYPGFKINEDGSYKEKFITFFLLRSLLAMLFDIVMIDIDSLSNELQKWIVGCSQPEICDKLADFVMFHQFTIITMTLGLFYHARLQLCMEV